MIRNSSSMPLKWMYANDPKMAERWEEHTPDKKLPKKVKKKASKKRGKK